MNRIDEAVTLATLPAFKPVVDGEMIATVKIIPFAVAAKARDQAVAEAAKAKPVIRIAPYKVRKVGVVSTLLPGLVAQSRRQNPQDHHDTAGADRRQHHRRAAGAA